ncbi:enamine deaminase RidA (YjgF/YER057c/UK114 family) [Sphingobium sp. OAS761]|uniref:RidA family protein n=1 Tax=Sphingobium sp. OAS761 TaxID=2817901 RepID=UPI00209D6F13|nr:RidA family protein [Sphingobium sp. OAS761]MCP1468408.1 enamine deaminase RidA (YjgF/YER057c/UK114 family) [Sphingobium sp. OAS761]
MRYSIAMLAALALAGLSIPAQAQVTRKQSDASPIAGSATVPPGATLYFLSGSTGSPIDPKVTDTPDAYGDTEAQTMSVLTKMKAQLADLGLTMGDVVKMTVFLVGDPKLGGKMDRDGMMRAYLKFFGTADQPNKPTRSAFQIAALARPQQLVEIEVIAAKAP